MLYILITADSFDESVLEELSEAADYRIIDREHNLLIADLDVKDRRKLEDAKFIYSYFPIHGNSRLGEGDYIDSIHKQMTELGIGKKTPLKIECFDINCRTDYSAKDIEVAIGGMLERDGFNVEIKNPETLAYAILLNSRCYTGFIKLSESANRFINPFRVYKGKSISRAEFKMIEAFDSFRLKAPKVAIDMGAAPGGWSLFLARNGAAVIAIDGAELENEKIRKAGVKVSDIDISGNRTLEKKDLESRSIVHMKCNLDKAIAHLGDIKADMLCDDMNVGGVRSSQAVLKYSRSLKKGAVLILTVKCMRRNVPKYIEEVEKILGSEFEIVKWKVLPHNRQEITLLARKR